MAPPLDIELQLQRHGTALRRLAFDLLRDWSDVDDAVQETWLRAVRWPPRDTHGVGRWLATALRNVVRRSRRRDALRERREQAVVVEHLVEDHALAAEREDTARRLFAALETLDAATRDVVWRRFFEGQPPREIAAARKEPVATVKSRLQRGIRDLRERLGKDGGGEWRPAFAAAFGLGKPGAAAGTVALAAGGTVMATWTKTAAVVVVLGAFALGVRWLLRDDGLVVERTAEAGAPAIAATVTDPPATPPPPVDREVVVPPERAAPAGATHAMARRRGRVVAAETGQPLAGVTVVFGYTMSVKPGANDVRVVTSDDGRFEFECLAERQSRLWFAHDERVGAWVEGRPLVGGESEEVADVQLQCGRSLPGRIVAPDGTPLPAGTVVEASFAIDYTIAIRSAPGQAHVGADGWFTLPPVPLGPVRILLPASDHELLDTRVNVTAHEPGVLQLVATLRPAVAGHVVGSDGRPIADIGVCLYPSGRRIRTDALGRFRLVRESETMPIANVGIHDALDYALPDGRSHSEMVECAPAVPWGTTDLRIVLHRSPPLPIEVVDERGEPVLQFGVVLMRPALGSSERGLVRQRGEHANGRLDVDRVTAGMTSLRVVPADPMLTPSDVLEVTSLAPMRVVLSRRVPCAVELTKGGRPVAGVFVDLVLAADRKPLSFGFAATKRPEWAEPHGGKVAWVPGESRRELISGGRTDANGIVHLWRDAANTARELVVQADGTVPSVYREPVFPADGSPLRVTLPEFGFVEGRVHLRERPHRDVGVWLRRGEQQVSVRVRADGAFRSVAIPAGAWRAELRTKGVVLGSERSVQVVDGTTAIVDWDFAAFPSASLGGRFVRDGAIAGFTVDVSRVGVANVPERIASVVLDAEGRFAAADLLAGTYRLVVRPTAGAALVPWLDATVVQLAAGEHRDVTIPFPARRLVVHFRRADGSEVRGQRIHARSDGVQWTTIFGVPVDEQVVIDPAPALPIEFRSANSTVWSAPVQMPSDRAETEVTVVLPDPPK